MTRYGVKANGIASTHNRLIFYSSKLYFSSTYETDNYSLRSTLSFFQFEQVRVEI